MPRGQYDRKKAAQKRLKGDLKRMAKENEEEASVALPRGHYNRKRQPLSKGTPIQLSVGVPPAGVVLKLLNGKKMMGTLVIEEEGILYIQANGKKKPERLMAWHILQNLSHVGFAG